MHNDSCLSFTIPGAIRGKQRAGRKRLPGGVVQTFNPSATASHERLIRQYAAIQMRRRTPFKGAMRLAIQVFKVPPKSWSKKRRATAKYVTGKPDASNVAKLVEDALNKLVWHDDAQIADLVVARRYAEVERTDIEIVALEDV
jgi:Holliday junction resolvase RusA-like endonuclease